LGELLGEKAYAAMKPYVKRCLAGEQVYFEKEINYQLVGKRFIAANLIPRYNGTVVIGYYALITDISERKRAQKDLEDALQETNNKNEELKRINIDLDNFVYTASHDLKSPIANLEGITGVLLKKISKKLEKDEIGLIELIHQMTTKLKSTIKDLTEITKVQKDFEEVPERVSFEEVFENIKADLSPLLTEYAAIISTDFEVKEINYARKNLRSILFNLANNALKYHSPERKPLIQIQTRMEGEYILLSIADNGLGIPAGQIHKLFSMFKRLHTHVEGSGIGLYITKRIIENNEGRIEVESEEGKGSMFKVFFKL
jgi:signal transduction histidine kinase